MRPPPKSLPEPMFRRMMQAPRREHQRYGANGALLRQVPYELPPKPADLGPGVICFDVERNEWRAIQIVRRF